MTKRKLSTFDQIQDRIEAMEAIKSVQGANEAASAADLLDFEVTAWSHFGVSNTAWSNDAVAAEASELANRLSAESDRVMQLIDQSGFELFDHDNPRKGVVRRTRVFNPD